MGDGNTFRNGVAGKVDIATLLNATFVKGEGWDPTIAALSSGTKLTKVNVLGTVVAKDEQGIFLNDGSSQIAVVSLQNPDLFSNISVGQLVQIIAKPRIYQDQKLLAAEICKPIQNKSWMVVRKKEIIGQYAQLFPTENAILEKAQKVQIKNQEEWVEKENTDTNTTQKKIYDLIKALDQGKGAPYEEVVSKAQHPDSPPEVEKIIELLLQKGYIFEITPGKLKVLD